MEGENEEVSDLILLGLTGWWRRGRLTRDGNLSDKWINYPKKYKIMKIY